MSTKMMLVTCILVSSLVAMATAQGKEYLPPNKGYNYEPPAVPFDNNAGKQPSPGPYRPPPPPPPPRPTYVPPPAPGPPRPNSNEHHDDHHHEPGMPFDFAYAVNENGNDYKHSANSDGDVTRGEYRVALPDGRTQIVKYTADWKNGFNAEVSYEGEAKYPDQPQGGAGGYSAPNPGPGQSYVPPNQGGGYQY